MKIPPATKEAYKAELIRRSAEGLFPCMDKKKNCLYRGPDGKECAAGILISDDKYTPSLEGKSLGNGHANLINAIQLPSDVSLEMVEKCQKAHDNRRHDLDWYHEGFVEEISEILK